MGVRRPGAAATLVVFALSLAAGSGSAAPILRPAPATPDPKLMVLRVPDLHAKVKRQRYFRDTEFPSSIAYERTFGPGRSARAKLLYATSLAEVGRSEEIATRFIALARRLAASSAELTLTKSFVRDFGETVAINSTLRVGHVRRLGAGESSFDLPLSAKVRGRRTDIHIALFHVERLVGALAVVGMPGSRVSLGAVARLATLMARRMALELAPKNVALPVVSGAPQVGQTLTASSGIWNGSPTSLAYRWQRCNASGGACAAVAGAVGQTYTLTDADAGSRIRISVSARNRYGSRTVRSAPTAAVAASAVPTNTAPPTITGSAQVGQTLTASTGSWNGSPTSFGFQWQRCDAAGNGCVAIPGATAGTYVVTASDSGATLRVAVTATNTSGSATAVSAPTPLVP